MSRRKWFEVTFIDTGKTVYWPESQCVKHFGRLEWPEYKAGYLPHVVACECEPPDGEYDG